MNYDNFYVFCHEINKLCITHQNEEKEIISDKDAFEAYSYIKYMSIYDTGDVLLYCTCLNLLNTYVKQPDCKINYKFKNEIGYLIDVLLNTQIQDIYLDCQKDNSNPLIILEIAGVQFSFHNIPNYSLKAITKNTSYKKDIEWDTIRKQMCAKSLFNAVKENKIRYSNLTFRNKNLNKRIEDLSAKYDQNKIGFEFFNSIL